MTVDAEALRAQIVARPHDDEPRLVYADWLSAQGDPLGEFITLQCRLATAPERDRRRLRAAENALLARHADVWAAPLRAVVGRFTSFQVRVEFERGFPQALTVPPEVLGHLEELFAVAPLLRSLRVEHLDGPPYTPASAFDSPLLARVRALTLELGHDDASVLVRALAASPHLAGLNSLSLAGPAVPAPAEPPAQPRTKREARLTWARGPAPLQPGRLVDADAAALARSPHLRGLQTLALPLNALGPRGAEAIANGGWDGLETLSLAWNPILAAGARAVAEGTSLQALRRLDLSHTPLGREGLVALGRSTQLPALTTLSLAFEPLSEAEAGAFFEALRLPALRALALEGAGVGDAGVEALVRSPVAPQLESLELGHNGLTARGVRVLTEAPALRNLKRLLLNDPYLKRRGVLEELLASEPLAGCRIYVKGRLLSRTKGVAPKKPKATRKSPGAA